MPDIHELWDEIRQHPDFAGGAMFTREHVAHALFEAEEHSFDEPPSEESIARVTEEMMRSARITLDSYIYSDSYTWIDAMRDTLATR